MRPALSRRLTGFGTTIFTEISRLAAEHGAVNLGQGFPDFDGPEFVKEAAIEAIRGGQGQYARMAGILPLTQAISDKYVRDYAIFYHPETEITVTSGATEAIWDAVQGLCDLGDEVVLFQPFYDSYQASIRNAGAIPRAVLLRTPTESNGEWSFDEQELRAAINDRTRVVLLNSPHNPTGKVFSPAELALIAKLCIQHDLICISDEVYEHLVFRGKHQPIATLPGMKERTITISSLGKTFSLTGWKIGWACAPPPLTAAVRTAHQFVTFATATPLQWGAVAALQAPITFYEQLLREYADRRRRLCDGLRQAGFTVHEPAGTYFAAAEFGRFGFDNDVAFTKYLIEEIGVAVIPPSSFYQDPSLGQHWVRFAFCKRAETLNAAIERLAKLALPVVNR